jgi:hypothetical protein
MDLLLFSFIRSIGWLFYPLLVRTVPPSPGSAGDIPQHDSRGREGRSPSLSMSTDKGTEGEREREEK